VLLRDAWSPAAGNFAATLGNAGPGNATFPAVKSAIDALVNQMVFLSEDIADAQLLAALGTRTGGQPRPEVLDAHRSGNGLADLLANLAGLETMYFGAMSQVVDNVNPETGGALSLSIQRALETAHRISVPLEQAVAQQKPLVERAQVRAKELMATLEIDLISVLGATLRFNPNDGD
jgi:predicted lipoprotein